MFGPVGLRLGHAARYIFLREVDAYPAFGDEEGESRSAPC